MLRIIAFSIIFLFLGIQTALGNPVYHYQFTKNLHTKPTDSIQFLQEQKRTVFLITHTFGIGAATISLASGHWPQDIALRFQYEKTRGFSTLENLEISTARFQINSDGSTTGKMPFRLADATGTFTRGDAWAGEMNVVLEKRNGAMEVTLPPNLLVGTRQVKLAWIDAYRR